MLIEPPFLVSRDHAGTLQEKLLNCRQLTDKKLAAALVTLAAAWVAVPSTTVICHGNGILWTSKASHEQL